MRIGEKGFTLNEMLVSLAITSLVAVSALMVIHQTILGNEQNIDYMTSVRQVANAGHWIGRDTQMAQSVTTDNLTPPDFLLLSWTERDTAGDPVYHSVKYFFDDVIDNTGTLMRYHWSSAGETEQTMVAQYICYDSTNTTHTSTKPPIKAARSFPSISPRFIYPSCLPSHY